MKIETLAYSDGTTNFQGYLADPEGSGLRPGVLVVHEAPGLNDHPKRRARLLAEEHAEANLRRLTALRRALPPQT